ncbi:hypothetical protein BKA64DRAFT_751004 [Cadophora sp. MPI-SDFR-AT-0126]|nr:hypothetical protein BKA64DRAFT_751004 [Leotiomycetes sp. MPI-SDFR-AT-0126]
MHRKQAKTDNLRKRISSLENAIEEMSGEFLKYGERVVSAEEVSGSSESSGRSQRLNELKGTTERFLSIARVAEKVAGEEEVEDEEMSEKLRAEWGSIFDDAGPRARSGNLQGLITEPSSSSITHPPMFSDLNVQTTFKISSLFPSVTSTHPSYMSIPPQVQPSAGRFSPRLGYGLLSTSPTRNAALNNLWTHYTISGYSSFALRLYTDTLSLMLRILRGELSIPGFIPSIARFRFKYETPDTFLSLAGDQLARMSISDPNSNPEAQMETNPNQIPKSAAEIDTGVDIDTNSSVVLFGPSHPVMSAPLRAKIHSEVNYEIGSMSEWLDPWNTQQYLLSRWGLRCSYATASVSADRWAGVNSSSFGNLVVETMPAMLPGNGSTLEALYPWDAQHQQLGVDVNWLFEDVGFQGQVPRHPDFVFDSGPLAEKLIKEAVCFGEGPRFFKEHIDNAVREFMGGGS